MLIEITYLFISLDGVCSDPVWDPDNERFTTDPNQSGTSYIWLKKSTEFARSEEACQSEMQHSKYSGVQLKCKAYYISTGVALSQDYIP